MIELQNVKAFYEHKQALDIPHAIFKEGSLTSIIGINGSGKSTLLKTVASLVTKTGNVLIDSKNAAELSRRERARKIAFLPQHNPVPEMTVQTLVQHGRYPRLGFSKTLSKEDLQQVQTAISLCGLEDKKHTMICALSGGEKQRAFLAMVIAQKTPMLFLDEPLTYLDIQHQIKVCSILKALCKEGRGIVMSCHDLPLAFSISDTIILMHEGKICAQDTPQALAQKTQLLKNTTGASLIKNSDSSLLYKYSLTGTL